MPKIRDVDLKKMLARSIGAKLPGKTKPQRIIEPAGAIVAAHVTPAMLDALDRWREKRGLSRADALLALADCGLRSFDHATRKRS